MQRSYSSCLCVLLLLSCVAARLKRLHVGCDSADRPASPGIRASQCPDPGQQLPGRRGLQPGRRRDPAHQLRATAEHRRLGLHPDRRVAAALAEASAQPHRRIQPSLPTYGHPGRDGAIPPSTIATSSWAAARRVWRSLRGFPCCCTNRRQHAWAAATVDGACRPTCPSAFQHNRYLVTHWNAGLTWIPSQQNSLHQHATALNPNLGQSTVWLVKPRFNALCEVVWSSNAVVDWPQPDIRARTTCTSVPACVGPTTSRTDLQIVPGVAVPFGFMDLQRQTTRCDLLPEL